MKILVCITHVPDTTAKISFTDETLDKEGVTFVIGPYDDFAIARAVELKESLGAQVHVLNVGLSETDATLRRALAIGADEAIRVDAFPSDSLFVAKQIYNVAKDRGYDLILMGRESSDYNSGLVHGMVAEMLGWPCINPCMMLNINGASATMTREIEGGKETIETSLPLVAGCQEPIAEWKIPNMRGIMTAKRKPLNVLQPVDVEDLSAYSNHNLIEGRKACKLFEPGQEEELVNELKNEAKVF